MIADHATNVRTETVAHAMSFSGKGSVVHEVRIELRRTLRDKTSVAQGREITREEGQRLPIHCEHVVIATLHVRCRTQTGIISFTSRPELIIIN